MYIVCITQNSQLPEPSRTPNLSEKIYAQSAELCAGAAKPYIVKANEEISALKSSMKNIFYPKQGPRATQGY